MVQVHLVIRLLVPAGGVGLQFLGGDLDVGLFLLVAVHFLHLLRPLFLGQQHDSQLGEVLLATLGLVQVWHLA